MHPAFISIAAAAVATSSLHDKDDSSNEEVVDNPTGGLPWQYRQDFDFAVNNHVELLLAGIILVAMALLLLLSRECKNSRRYKFFYIDAVKNVTEVDEGDNDVHNELDKRLVLKRAYAAPTKQTYTLRDRQLRINFPGALRVRRVVQVYTAVASTSSTASIMSATGIISEDTSSSSVTSVNHTHRWVTQPHYVESNGGGSASTTPADRGGDLETIEWTVKSATIGQYTVDRALLAKHCNWFILRPISNSDLSRSGKPIWRDRKLSLHAMYVYLSATGESSTLSPAVGDVKIQYYEIPSSYMSAIGQQSEQSLVPYPRARLFASKTITEATSLLSGRDTRISIGYSASVPSSSQQAASSSPEPSTSSKLTDNAVFRSLYNAKNQPPPDAIFALSPTSDSASTLIENSAGHVGHTLGDWLLRLLCSILLYSGLMMVSYSVTYDLHATLLLLLGLQTALFFGTAESIGWMLCSPYLMLLAAAVQITALCLSYTYLLPDVLHQKDTSL